MQEIPFNSGDEQDALTGGRKIMAWNRGELRRIKRAYRRRVRKWAKRNALEEAKRVRQEIDGERT